MNVRLMGYMAENAHRTQIATSPDDSACVRVDLQLTERSYIKQRVDVTDLYKQRRLLLIALVNEINVWLDEARREGREDMQRDLRKLIGAKGEDDEE